ncbi:MAG: hypothetical protein ABWY37_11390 [Microbacterium pygmaeum]
MNADRPDSPRSSGMAAEYLSADLERRRLSTPMRLLRNGAAIVLSAFGAGGEDALPGFELVVKRLDTGADVLRANVGQFEEATHVLATVRDELTRKSVEQFVSEWKHVDA